MIESTCADFVSHWIWIQWLHLESRIITKVRDSPLEPNCIHIGVWEKEKENFQQLVNSVKIRSHLYSNWYNISHNNLLNQKGKELDCSLKICNLKDSGCPIKWNRNNKILMSRYRNGLNGICVPAKCSYTVTRKTIPNSYLPIYTACDYIPRCAKPSQASHSILSTKTKFIWLNQGCHLKFPVFLHSHQKLTAHKMVIDLKVCKY